MNENDIKVQSIGAIDLDVGNCDEYILLTNKEFDDLKLSEVEEYVYERFMYDHGTRFCRGFTVMIKPTNPWEAIVTIHHRNDN